MHGKQLINCEKLLHCTNSFNTDFIFYQRKVNLTDPFKINLFLHFDEEIKILKLFYRN